MASQQGACESGQASARPQLQHVLPAKKARREEVIIVKEAGQENGRVPQLTQKVSDSSQTHATVNTHSGTTRPELPCRALALGMAGLTALRADAVPFQGHRHRDEGRVNGSEGH